jgi:hypothetical protein
LLLQEIEEKKKKTEVEEKKKNSEIEANYNIKSQNNDDDASSKVFSVEMKDATSEEGMSKASFMVNE